MMANINAKNRLCTNIKYVHFKNSFGINSNDLSLENFIISRVTRILTSRNRIQLLYDEIFDIDRFLE